MSEGKRKSILGWKRHKDEVVTKHESKSDDQAQVTVEPVNVVEEDRLSFETALTSTETHNSAQTIERIRSNDSKHSQPSVASAVKGVGDAIRFRVKESWNSRGKSSTHVSEAEHTSAPIESHEKEQPPPILPPRPPRPALPPTRSLPATSGPEIHAVADTQHHSDALVPLSDVQTVPADLSQPSQQLVHETGPLPPPYTRTLSAPTTVPARPIAEVLIPIATEERELTSHAVEQIESDLALVRIASSEQGLVASQQAQDVHFVNSDSKELSLVHTSQKWLAWSVIEQELRVNIGTLPYVEETPPTCELCEERLIMEGPNDKVVTSPGVHVCETCGEFRILCERCARLAINLPQDPHEADHILQRVGPITLYSLKDFLHKYDLQVADQEESTIAISQSWLNSDFAFRASVEATTMLAHITLRPPPGMHKLTIDLRVVFDEASVSSGAIGIAAKQWLKTTKKPSGEISVGADVVSSDIPSSPGMPANTVQNPIVYTSGKYTFPLTVTFGDNISLTDDQVLRIHIKSTHNTSIFKAGCPFSWYFESARMEEYGEGKHLATKGQLLKRGKDVETMKVLEKRETRDRRIGYVGTAVGLGTGVAGLGPAIGPAVQGIGAVLRR